MNNTTQINYKKFYPTAVALYFTYFIHGIGASIIGQYKQNLAAQWGAEKLADGTFDVSMVIAVIAALGLGRLISLPFSGPISDKFGRKVSGLIGIICYVLYLGGIAFSPSMTIGYMFAIVGGIANSFLDTCVSPSCMEIFPKNGSIANMFTKFSISVAQFLLPFMIGFVVTSALPFKTIFLVAAAAIAIDGLLIVFLPFPLKNSGNQEAKSNEPVKKEKMKFTPVSIALISIGFTCSSTFMIWLNCNQELGKLYGVLDPSKIQSLYAAGTVCAILMSTVLIKKGIKPVKILILYPAVATIMLIAIYFVKNPTIVLVGGFVLGYSAAGGVLQLCVSTANEMFPNDKGKITSIVMIASSIANYTVLNLASYLTKVGGTQQGPLNVILLNIVVTFIGVLLALYVNKEYKKQQIA
ncbi:MFS transporter [Terrisporobacter petrolearius]|uniref:MFS transporter n=1 Tax=Terrisporobacter petrolearius TaxID=1460447 RepID=UPI002240EE54|nr:MFS transporter [Terrisporobacter petrolearius]